MTTWRPDPAALKRPVYQSLVSVMTDAIEAGTLAAGARLPTHRRMADDLGVSVQTVSRAYDALIRLGLIVGQVGRGTFVRSRPEPAPPYIPERREGELIDLSMLKPVAGQVHEVAMRTALHALADSMPDGMLFSFRPNVVLRRHREIAVEWLARCGIPATPDSVLITNGATPAIAAALMTALRPGELVATEAIGHHTLVPLANYLGVKLAGLPMDDEGILPDALDALCHARDVKVLFLMPTAAGPTVALMKAERRDRIADIARRHDIMIVENEAWGPLIADRPPPFAALAPERTFNVTSFTKCVLPGLRVGYLVVPERLMPASANRHLVTSWMATATVSEIAARWVADGTAAKLVDWQRQALAARHDIVRRQLGGVPYRAHPQSLHLWLPLPSAWTEDGFVQHARLHGVAIAPGSSFRIGDTDMPPAVRICIGATSETELTVGLRVIARLAESAPEPALLAI